SVDVMHSNRKHPSSLSPRQRWAAIAATAVVAVSGVAVAASQAAAPASPSPAPSSGSQTSSATQHALDGLVGEDGFTGALASVQRADGTVVDYTAGTGDLATGEAVPTDGYVRIGSNTKTYTAVVLLQLVEEGKVSLDAKVETY